MQKALPRTEALNSEQVRSTANAIDVDHRHTAIDTLNEILADTVVIAHGFRQAHWNVRGSNFDSVHVLFGDAYKQLDEHIDELAERIAALGGIVKGAAHQATDISTLDPYPALAIDEGEHMSALSARLGHYTSALREAIRRCDRIDDPVSVHHLTEVAACAEKLLWRVESHNWRS